MSNTSINTCSGTFYDSGGASGSYQNSENFTITFCSSTPGNRISFNFTSFVTENTYEHLIIYDGPNTSSPQIGNYTGTNSPGTITSTGSCLTFVFTSDGSVTYAGWVATISCLPPPTGYNMGNLGTISTCSGYFFDSGGGTASYSNNENYTVTFCSSLTGQQIRFIFSNFNTQAGNDILTVYNGPNTSSPLLGTYSGTTLPPVLTSTSGCLTFVFSSNASTNAAGWMATISCTTPQPPTLCGGANPFCTGTTYNFPAGVNAGSAEVGANYGCLFSQPNPAWYYLQVQNSGNIEIEMHSNPQYDIDFACWGPFTNQTTPCVSQLTAGSPTPSHAAPGPSPNYPSLNMIDCSYSTSWQEWCYIPNAISGQYYILLITNYSNQTTNIIFSQTGGTGTTNCGILAPPITNNGPLCVGQTLQLTVTNPTPGAIYNWTGPNGFTSNQMNPVINNVTTANAGVYTLTITVGSQTSPPVTTTVVINANPVVSATATPSVICNGQSSTLSGNGANNYIWMPGNLSGASLTVSPTSTTTYSVTGTSSAGCSGSSTVTVTVNPNPVLSLNSSSPAICDGQSTILSANGASTYIWMPGNLNGSQVTVSPNTTTVYSITGTSTAGCTSSSTITVTVFPLPVITLNPTLDTICNGQTTTLNASGAQTYFWQPGNINGSQVSVNPNTTTTYTVTGTSSNGCVSSNSVLVNVNQLPVVVPSLSPASICNGQSTTLSAIGADTYIWMPGNLTGNSLVISPITTTVYTVTGTSLSGCSSTASITLTVNPNPVVSASASPSAICLGQNASLGASGASTYTWLPGNLSGNSVSVSPTATTTYTVTGASNSGCTGTATISVTVNPNPVLILTATPNIICTGQSSTLSGNGAANYSWQPGSMSGNTAVVSPNATTTYSVTGTSSAGCSSTANISVTVNPNPVVTASANPGAVCLGDPSVLTAIGAVSYTWLPGNLNGQNVNVTPTTTTTYTVTGTSQDGCTSSNTVTVTVNQNLTLTPTAQPSSICSGQSSALSCTGANTYLWLPDSLTGSVINVNPAVTTVYTVSGISTSGCTGSASITVSVNQNPIIIATALPDTICPGQSSTLNAIGGSSYQWSPGVLNGSQVVVTPTQTTTYTVQGTDINGCMGSATVTVNRIIVPPLFILTNPESGCAPLEVDFSFSCPVPVADSSWTWNFGDQNSPNNSSAEMSPSHTYDNGGFYIIYLSATSTDGCPLITSDSVVVSKKPVADFYFTPDFAYDDYPVIDFKDQSIYASAWEWDFGDYLNPNFNYSYFPNPTHSFSNTGTYHVQLIAKNQSCSDTTAKDVTIYDAALIYTPNAFTPNGDEINDVFKPVITGIEPDNYSFYIYDRWGKEIFSTHNPDEGWDGKINNKFMPTGVYTYIVVYKEILGKTVSKKGIFVLIR